MKHIHTEEYKNIIRKLKQARISAGFNQEEVAKALNKPQSYISKIENCERRLDILEAKKFCELYKIRIESLI